jgi:ABC-2 type transport system ATP-binding protein
MDEAERCHRLAILDRGVKVADGAPADLQRSIGMAVIEVQARDPHAAHDLLEDLPGVASVTQLGVRLRVLVPESIDDPMTLLGEPLADRDIEAEYRRVEPSLEDVFVAVTRKESGDGRDDDGGVPTAQAREAR